MNLYTYGATFFDYQQVGSLASARAVVPLLVRRLQPRSVLDVGCGAGAWVRAWAEAGTPDAWGVDAGYVQPRQLLCAPSQFRVHDVAAPFDLGREFDLAQCLEVAEHLAPAASGTLVDNLVSHARVVLFSAAPPGQGGEHHVNERPYAFWRDLFAERDFELFDFVRPLIAHRADVEPWYRYNILLFARRDAVAGLDPAITAARIPVDQPVPDHAPWRWRWRRHALARLPVPAVTALAHVRHRLFLARRRGAQP